MRVKKLLRYMYVCMLCTSWLCTSWHHIKFLVKIRIFEHFGIKKCDCYMYVYKLAPHKIFGKICIFEHFSNKKCDRYMYVCIQVGTT